MMSMTVESLPPTVIVGANNTPPNESVKVPALAEVLVATMLVTTVTVEDGTVYSVVVVVVVAAPRKSVFDTVAINYNFL